MTSSHASSSPLVSIIMGSQSDWPTMQHAADLLTELDVSFETRIVSAHRTPKRLYDFAQGAAERGIQAIIAGAGGSAHLPGMVAALTLVAPPMPALWRLKYWHYPTGSSLVA